ncbi:DUF551 domain-containing protein [Klebsiella quasipneumoniae]|uniref:DUF551 domain-containing protein n=1 Tax=Klebsiella quasipneumoniae TaxID=1463165 RepID=UPI0024772F99|nr:DUF551 domain-containing protein [Klebsiella quasipneumoniae]GMA01877.1 hypothetical protein KML003_20000 [Klebsiella quasipneumoniae subsp. similipneumoniae]
MTSKLTRERLEEIRDYDTCVTLDESAELARMALAAMDSESWCLPLDYLQGHKDGLEFASQLAEANHPETGDWLYDDPIELAKAIRKGPDMPPAQPAADSEPDRNPVLAYADSYRDMAKQGVESVPIWSVITDLERNIAPLYRHAQPAPASEPVYQYWCYTTVENSEGDPEEFWFWKDCEKDFYDRWKNAKRTLYKTPQPALVVPPEQYWEELCRQHPDMSIGDAIIRAAWWNHCRAAMLQASPVCTCPSGDGSLRWPCPVHAGSSLAIPDGWTGNDKANAALMMLDRIETADPVDDDRIDGIKRIVRELAAAPHDTPALNPVQSVVTVPGKWIPVSEQMPPSRHEVLVGRWWGEKPRWCCKWATYIPGHPDAQSSGWLLPGASWTPTHWMPLPAAPQEVNRE